MRPPRRRRTLAVLGVPCLPGGGGGSAQSRRRSKLRVGLQSQKKIINRSPAATPFDSLAHRWSGARCGSVDNGHATKATRSYKGKVAGRQGVSRATKAARQSFSSRTTDRRERFTVELKRRTCWLAHGQGSVGHHDGHPVGGARPFSFLPMGGANINNKYINI